jgi:hypothetical protein
MLINPAHGNCLDATSPTLETNDSEVLYKLGLSGKIIEYEYIADDLQWKYPVGSLQPDCLCTAYRWLRIETASVAKNQPLSTKRGIVTVLFYSP